MRISALERCEWSGKKSDVGLIRIMPADGTVAAITPARISASFPRLRQLADSLYRSAAKEAVTFWTKHRYIFWTKHRNQVSEPDVYRTVIGAR